MGRLKKLIIATVAAISIGSGYATTAYYFNESNPKMLSRVIFKAIKGHPSYTAALPSQKNTILKALAIQDKIAETCDNITQGVEKSADKGATEDTQKITKKLLARIGLTEQHFLEIVHRGRRPLSKDFASAQALIEKMRGIVNQVPSFQRDGTTAMWGGTERKESEDNVEKLSSQLAGLMALLELSPKEFAQLQYETESRESETASREREAKAIAGRTAELNKNISARKQAEINAKAARVKAKTARARNAAATVKIRRARRGK